MLEQRSLSPESQKTNTGSSPKGKNNNIFGYGSAGSTGERMFKGSLGNNNEDLSR